MFKSLTGLVSLNMQELILGIRCKFDTPNFYLLLLTAPNRVTDC